MVSFFFISNNVLNINHVFKKEILKETRYLLLNPPGFLSFVLEKALK